MKRWTFILLGSVIALLGLYALLAGLADPVPEHAFFRDIAKPTVIAHRGGAGLRPENTLAAFSHAVALGVDVLEMDIHATADGTLVVIHDSTVDRTTNGSGKVKEMTLAEVRQLDAGYQWSPDNGQTFPYRGQGITIPTLEEVFQAFPDTRMNIEIKQREPSIAGTLCDLIRAYAMQEKVLVASFHKTAMQEFRAACPEVATASYKDEMRVMYALATLRLIGIYSPVAQAAQVPEYWGDIRVITPAFVRGMHARGIQVHAWTINEPEDMQRLLALGVDGIITNYPDRLLTLLGR